VRSPENPTKKGTDNREVVEFWPTMSAQALESRTTHCPSFPHVRERPDLKKALLRLNYEQ
jgi:hypothetical protein